MSGRPLPRDMIEYAAADTRHLEELAGLLLSTMYEMVQSAYKVTLVSCIVPLAAGIYWRRANVPGAALSVVFGLGSWALAEWVAADATVPPHLVGLAFSIFGMVMGSFIPHAHPAAHAPHASHAHGAHPPQKT